MMAFLCLLRLVSISVLCIPYTSHVYSLQSMYTSHRPSLPTRVDGCTPQRSITRFSRRVSPLNASSSKGLSRAQRWEIKYNLLCRYSEREGHVNVPEKHVEDGENLGRWLWRQRTKYKAGNLQPERQNKLELLGVQWETMHIHQQRWDMQWEKMYNILCRYSEREGHVNVPEKHVEDGENLGQWLLRQRQKYKAGNLQPERQNKLESLGVLWVTMHVRQRMFDMRWEKMFDLLCTYKEREGHVNVPVEHVEDGENLGQWLGRQRIKYKDGNLQPERQNKLESLGVLWVTMHVRQRRLDMQWEKMFDLLCMYREREGHVNVPGKHVEDGENLGQWLGQQRIKYKDGNLQPERQNKLESLGVLWVTMHVRQSMFDMRWEKMFDLLCTYKEREGHVNVPGKHVEDGENLGQWVATQIRAYRNGTLQARREVKLESLGVQWERRISVRMQGEKEWQRNFNLLCIFKEREGHTNVSRSHQEGGVNLGKWLANQRSMYRTWALRPERQRKLESLGVEWDGVRGEEMRDGIRWENMFTILCTYKEREGHVNVPEKHKEGSENLGGWLRTQRKLYNTGTLCPERQNKLESLGVIWDTTILYQRRFDMKWEKMFDLLCTYKEQEGHINVPYRYQEDGQNLGFWLAHQRRLYNAGTLRPERQSKLETLGVRWKLR